MIKKQVSVIITDFDNTLYDQFGIWHASFIAILDRLLKDGHIDRQTLINEIKEVHQLHGTSEYAFLLRELPFLQRNETSSDAEKIRTEAGALYRSNVTSHLRLYPMVAETLKTLKESGCVVVCYTEAQSFYSEYKLTELGLDGVVDYLYSAENHDMPSDLTSLSGDFYPTEYSKPANTIHCQTMKGVEKPDPQVLLKIIEELGVAKDEVIYVGDKKSKDIVMAQTAGVTDVHALYGVADKRPEYDLLRQVTHWKGGAVESEINDSEISPTFTLRESFCELLTLFRFVPLAGSTAKRANPLQEWKEALRTARSFNTLLLQLRGFGIPVVITIMGGGVAFGKDIGIPNIPVKYASITLIAIAILLVVMMLLISGAAKGGTADTKLTALEKLEGVILWVVLIGVLGLSFFFYPGDFFGNTFAVSSPGVIGVTLFALSLLLGLYGMDRCYYYKLLIGAVKRARELEDKMGFSLTDTIGKVAPLSDSKTLITTMYWLPALGALIAVVILAYLKLWTHLP